MASPYQLGCHRFVVIGTCSEYDLREGYLSETSPVHPDSPYAASKLALAVVLDQVGKTMGMDTKWVRLFYQNGPFEGPASVDPFCDLCPLRGQKASETDGRQTRDFLHVEDVAGAIVAVVLSELTGVVNVASGQATTVRDVVATIGKVLGRSELLEFGAIPTPPSDPMCVCGVNSRLLSTGWAPTYDLGTGLHHTIAWWQRRLRVCPEALQNPLNDLALFNDLSEATSYLEPRSSPCGQSRSIFEQMREERLIELFLWRWVVLFLAHKWGLHASAGQSHAGAPWGKSFREVRELHKVDNEGEGAAGRF